MQPFQSLGTQKIPTPLKTVNLQHREPRNHLCPIHLELPGPQGCFSTGLSTEPHTSEKEQTSSSPEEEDGFNILHERKIRGKRPTGTREMAAGAVLPAARTQQAGSHQHRIPRLPKEEGEREEKRSSETHTQQHHSWELGLCNKGPVSGSELQAIKSAATDPGETAGIYPRNPDYVATAEAEQKAPSSWKAKRWQVMSNQLHYPTVPASPTRARASSRHIGGGGSLS